MLLRAAAVYEQIGASYALAANEACQIANGGQPMTKEDILRDMQGSLVVSERSMQLAIGTATKFTFSLMLTYMNRPSVQSLPLPGQSSIQI